MCGLYGKKKWAQRIGKVIMEALKKLEKTFFNQFQNNWEIHNLQKKTFRMAYRSHDNLNLWKKLPSFPNFLLS